MFEAVNTVQIWGFGLVSLLFGILTLHLLRQVHWRRPWDRAGLSFLGAVLLTACWGGFSLAAMAQDEAWWAAVALVDVLRYACWYAFVAQLFKAGQEDADKVNLGRGMVVLAIALPILGMIALGLAGRWSGATPEHATGWVLLVMMLLAVFGLVLVEQLFRNLPEDARWSAKPVCLGLAGTFLFDLYLFSQGVLFRGIDLDAWNARGVAHALMMPLLLISTMRHKNWIAKIHVSRTVVFHSATLLIAGIYLLFIAVVGYYVRYFGSDWGRAVGLALVFAGLMLLLALIVSSSFRARLRVFLGKNFFRYRFDYRLEWLNFTQRLSQHAAPDEISQNVIRAFADMMESPAGGLWLARPGDAHYKQVASWNLPRIAQAEPESSSLMAFMRTTGWVVNLEEYRAYPGRYGHLQMPSWFHQCPQAWLIVPLWQTHDLLGFVMLASPRTPVDVNWEVHDLLKTAGRQAASFLGQMQATEALLESRKFEAFSKMSAFVVHDLKNIVTQLSLMMKNAKRLKNNPEFQEDMLMTVENSLERMRQMMLQLREGAVPTGSAVGVDLERIAQILATGAHRRGRQLALRVQPQVFTRGHVERLERVIGHLVQNAFDATSPQDGAVCLKIDRFGSHARVQVEDNGKGMSKDFVQNRLFKPFQTTKSAGMGIGAYESFQYVQELGGKIEVDSQEGSGTVVTLLLPLIEVFQKSDLHRLEEA